MKIRTTFLCLALALLPAARATADGDEPATGAPRVDVHRKGAEAALRLVLPAGWLPAGARDVAVTSPDGACRLFWRAPRARVRESEDADRAPGTPAPRPPAETSFLCRFEGQGPHEVRVSWLDPTGARVDRPATVMLPVGDVDHPEILQAWADAGAASVESVLASAPARDSFLSFLDWSWSTRLRAPATAAPDTATSEDDEAKLRREALQESFRDRERPDLLSVATGFYAVQESLQLDALSSPKDSDEPAVAPISGLHGPKIASHPFAEMIQARTAPEHEGSGKHPHLEHLRDKAHQALHAPVVEPIAQWVPADCWYLRLAGVQKLSLLEGKLDAWAEHMARVAADSSTDARVAARALAQLGLSEDILQHPELLRSVKEVALCGTDPFFREGTAVCAIFATDDVAGLDAAIDAQWAAAMARTPGAAAVTDSTESAARGRIRGVVSPDRSLSAWRMEAVDGCIAISSSLALLRAVGEARNNARPSLAGADDFRYMRLLLPAGADEDAFLYLSDAHIRALVGPGMKLAERRRLGCATALLAVSNAADLFRMERRRAPASLDEIVGAGFLPAAVARCPERGAITLGADGRTATCSVHGRLGSLLPLRELPAIEKVTATEKADYERFVSEYETYWRTYFDPVGVRLKLDKGLEADTIILPLIDNSVYDGLRGVAEGATGHLGGSIVPADTIFHAQLGVSGRAVLSGFFRDVRRQVMEAGAGDPGDLERAFGADVTLGLCDDRLLFDFDVHELLSLPFQQHMSSDFLAIIPLLTSLNLPTYVSVPVRDRAGAEQAIDALKVVLRRATAQARDNASRGRQPEVEFDVYDLPAQRGARVSVIAMKFVGVVKWRAFYAFVGDRLYVASKADVLAEIIEAGAAGGAQALPAIGDEEDPVTLRLLLDPTAFKKIVPDVLLGWAEHARRACLANEPGVWGSALAQGGDIAAALSGGLPRRGANFVCPDLGEYRIDPATGRVSCTSHGAIDAPEQLMEPRALPGVKRFLDRLGPMRLELGLTRDGLRVHVKVEER